MTTVIIASFFLWKILLTYKPLNINQLPYVIVWHNLLINLSDLMQL